MKRSDIAKKILDQTELYLSTLYGKPINVVEQVKLPLTEPAEVITAICEVTGFTLDNIRQRDRKGNLPAARQIMSYYLFYRCEMQCPEISRLLKMDRTNIHHNLSKVQQMIEIGDDLYMTLITKIEKLIDL